MPDMTPVANQIIPPDPSKGINTFSGILGLQQQKQSLALGQQALQVGQADVQQKQQAMQERLTFQKMMQTGENPEGKSILNDRGEPDPDQVISSVSRHMPLTGQPIIQSIIKTQSDKANLDDAVRGLNQGYKNDLSGIARSFANNPNAKSSDIESAFDAYAQQNPRALAAVHWATNLIGDHYDNMPAQKRNDALLHIAQQLQPAASTAAQQQPAPTLVQGKGGLNLVETSPLAMGGAGQQLNAAPIGQGLSPTQQPGYLGQVATTTGAATGAVDVDRETFGNVMKASSKSGTVIDLAKKVRELAGQVRTGKLSGEFANNLTILQQQNPQATERQLMEKYAANLKTAVESAGGTDAEREQIGKGFPTPDTMNPAALEEAAGYAEGTGHLAQQRAQNAIEHVSKNGGIQGLSVNDASFMKGKSPLTFAPKKALPTGPRLQAYADKYTGGDVNKATAELKKHGYE